MPNIHVIDSAGTRHQLSFTPGSTLMEFLRDAGFEEVEAICGGCCSCATCHVHVIAGLDQLPEMEEDEQMLLTLAEEFDESVSRLSCQIPLAKELDGLTVQLVENT